MAILDRFHCQVCVGHTCELTEQNPVTNEMCGCNYSKGCFEGLFRNQTRDHILAWNFNQAGKFRCMSALHNRGHEILKGSCVAGDMVRNPEYQRVWKKYEEDQTQDFDDLVSGCHSHFTALVPEYLRVIYQAKLQDDKKPEGERNCFDNWNAQVKGSQARDPEYKGEWGIFTKGIFIARCIYHVAVAIVCEIGLFIVSFVVSKDSYDTWRSGDVGDRITELYMQYYGLEYDYSRPNTLENRFIRWLCGD